MSEVGVNAKIPGFKVSAAVQRLKRHVERVIRAVVVFAVLLLLFHRLIALRMLTDGIDSGNRNLVRIAIQCGSPANVRCYENFDLIPAFMDWVGFPHPSQDVRPTALELACSKGNLNVVKVLLRNGADVNGVDLDNDTPLMYARDGEIVKELVASGANTEHLSFVNRATALMLADDRSVIQAIIESHADIEAHDWLNRTPLHYSAVQNNFTKAKILLGNGAKVNVQDKMGITPLMLACMFGDSEMVSLLMTHNASLTIRDFKGHDALWHSRTSRRKDCEKELTRVR